MKEYLIAICFHEAESYKSWLKGEIEDYESSTGIFITANSELEALKWGEIVADKLFKTLNPGEQKSWKDFEYDCRIEDVESSAWQSTFGFFQKIKYGEMPNFDLMGTAAFKQWILNNRTDEWILKHYGKYFYE
ncbi:MAG: hypothetical protein NVSMB24_09520 [Mucilaginibacter sp.]